MLSEPRGLLPSRTVGQSPVGLIGLPTNQAANNNVANSLDNLPASGHPADSRAYCRDPHNTNALLHYDAPLSPDGDFKQISDTSQIGPWDALWVPVLEYAICNDAHWLVAPE